MSAKWKFNTRIINYKKSIHGESVLLICVQNKKVQQEKIPALDFKTTKYLFFN